MYISSWTANDDAVYAIARRSIYRDALYLMPDFESSSVMLLAETSHVALVM